MTDVTGSGHRRIDRVLDERFLAGIGDVDMAEVRALRDDADQEETDLSFLRRLLQGRMDILAAELERRKGGPGASTGGLLADLPRILSSDSTSTRSPAHGLGRHQSLEPSRAGESRRYVESLVGDAGLSNLSELAEEDLERALDRLRAGEAETSARRQQVHKVLDACSAELTRRYRDGEADVADLLPTEGD